MKTEEKVIGGVRYKMEQVGAETGEEILLRLSVPMAALFSGALKRGPVVSRLEQVADGIVPALRALAPKDLRFIRRALVAKTTVWIPDGKHGANPWPLADHYDHHFAGRYKDAIAFLKWGVQFNAFFGNALELVEQELAATKESGSSSPRERAGGPGDSSSTPAPEARA